MSGKKKKTRSHRKPEVPKPIPVRKMELLAPAGSEANFFAAIESGADALYMGLSAFNARMRADNFNFKMLETALAYAHEKNVHIYLTLNTLVKQGELPALIDTLLRLEHLRPDALIVQDWGVAMLAQTHAPSVPLHASTQMTIHNSAGASLMEKLGFSRVILARECNVDQIAAIGARTNIGIEVFAHGALCFSYSGQCYFSSYLGGHSANRGRCTQPCRRSYSANKNDGAFFSPGDLCLVDRLPELSAAGVVSIKIEGRLRSEAYVRQVVSAYRQAIDSLPGKASAEIIEQAVQDFGRSKSTGHFAPSESVPLIQPHRTAGAGRFLGKVSAVNDREVSFKSHVELSKDDRLRITGQFEGERPGFVLDQFEVDVQKELTGDTSYFYRIQTPVNATPGDIVFLIGRRFSSGDKPKLKDLEHSYNQGKKMPRTFRAQVDEAMGQLRGEMQTAAANVHRLSRQYVRVALPPGAKDIVRLMDQRVDEYILPLRHREIFSLARGMRNKVVLRLPMIIREQEVGGVARKIREVVQRGFTRFLVGNAAHIDLLEPYPEARLQADYTFGVLNSAAVLALSHLGIELVAFSIENDTANFESMKSAIQTYPMELVAYGRPPLFTSEIDPPLPKSRNAFELGGRDENILVERDMRLTVVLPKTPFSLTGALKSHQIKGLAMLRMELSVTELQRPDYDNLRAAVSKWTPIKGVRPFNFRTTGGLQ